MTWWYPLRPSPDVEPISLLFEILDKPTGVASFCQQHTRARGDLDVDPSVTFDLVSHHLVMIVQEALAPAVWLILVEIHVAHRPGRDQSHRALDPLKVVSVVFVVASADVRRDVSHGLDDGADLLHSTKLHKVCHLPPDFSSSTGVRQRQDFWVELDPPQPPRAVVGVPSSWVRRHRRLVVIVANRRMSNWIGLTTSKNKCLDV